MGPFGRGTGCGTRPAKQPQKSRGDRTVRSVEQFFAQFKTLILIVSAGLVVGAQAAKHC